LKASRQSKYSTYEDVWAKDGGISGESLVDIPRLEYDNVLSIFLTANMLGTGTEKHVTVLDFTL